MKDFLVSHECVETKCNAWLKLATIKNLTFRAVFSNDV